MAIANFVFAKGLSFPATQGLEFRRVLKCAKQGLASFIPPSRQMIAGELLDLTYQQRMDLNVAALLRDAEVFGLCLFGDGTTVKRMPLISTLCSGVHERTSVLEIVDCTSHMTAGGKKDARYIAKLFEPHMELLDKNKMVVDLLFFNGRRAGFVC
jgi:hypothetical protein